jgi:hypothetical protein
MNRVYFACIVWSIWTVGLLILKGDEKTLTIGSWAFSLCLLYVILFP